MSHSFRLLGVMLLETASLLAQTTASLTGMVADSTGASVPSARVILSSVDTGLRRETASAENGLYQFQLLQPGLYAITVQKDGFKQISREGI